MMRALLVFAFLLGLTFPIKAQTAAEPNEGSRMNFDSTTGICAFNWWGRSGMSYFVKYSEDLVTWSYLPLIVQGADAVAGINYQTNAVRLFMRLEMHPDPFNTDSDGDGMSDGWEVTNGLNHIINDAVEDADGDGAPNIYEYKLGATDPQIAASKPAANITVDPSVVTETATEKWKIQTAINAVANGAYAYISIKPGTYIEDVIIQDKHILLMAEAGSGPVILSPAASFAAIRVYYHVSDTTLSGLTLRPANPVQTARGIFIYAQTAATRVAVTNCVIQGFTSNYGGGIDVDYGQLWVTHCTIIGNKAANTNGQGIFVYTNSSLRLRNSILWNPTESSAPDLVGYTANPDITVQSSIIRGGSIWGGINADPNLGVWGELTAASTAAINQGTPLAATTSASGVAAPVFDIHGEIRQATQPDIGADEFVDTDGDGLLDSWEMHYFGNLNQVPSDDADGDGLTNYWESLLGLDPTKKDTLQTGRGDLFEGLNLSAALTGDGTWQTDTDNDGLTKVQEMILGTNPVIADSFNLGITDGQAYALGLFPVTGDWDGDQLTNAQEFGLSTSAFLADTDGDDVPDTLDAYPLDPLHFQFPQPVPNDTTPPVIQLLQPAGAVPVP